MQRWLGTIGAAFIRIWVTLFGKRVKKSEARWLLGPIGPDGEIGDRPYEIVAREEGLTIVTDARRTGLVPDFDVLGGDSFDVARTDDEVRRFYEETSEYDLDAWSESPFPGRIFLWLIVHTVSRAMNQLNFPVLGLDLSRGMTSEILPLRNSAGDTIHTGWYRRERGSGRVIYTGFYQTARVPLHASPCVKVVFPLPRGNATVVLKPGLDDEGRFTLLSSGAGFGDAGFYRVVETDPEHLKVLRLSTLREHFVVYTDERGELRCDHTVRFLGMMILKLHYRMRRKP